MCELLSMTRAMEIIDLYLKQPGNIVIACDCQRNSLHNLCRMYLGGRIFRISSSSPASQFDYADRSLRFQNLVKFKERNSSGRAEGHWILAGAKQVVLGSIPDHSYPWPMEMFFGGLLFEGDWALSERVAFWDRPQRANSSLAVTLSPFLFLFAFLLYVICRWHFYPGIWRYCIRANVCLFYFSWSFPLKFLQKPCPMPGTECWNVCQPFHCQKVHFLCRQIMREIIRQMSPFNRFGTIHGRNFDRVFIMILGHSLQNITFEEVKRWTDW